MMLLPNDVQHQLNSSLQRSEADTFLTPDNAEQQSDINKCERWGQYNQP